MKYITVKLTKDQVHLLLYGLADERSKATYRVNATNYGIPALPSVKQAANRELKFIIRLQTKLSRLVKL